MGRNYRVYPRPGALAVVVGEDAGTHVVRASGTLTLNSPKGTLTLRPEGTAPPRAVFARIDVKAGDTHSEVRLNRPTRVPFTVEQGVGPGVSSLDLRRGRALADALQASLVGMLPEVGNDGVHDQDLALARPTTQLSVLIETAFLTDKGNLRRLMSGAGRERFAQATTQESERFYRGAAVAQRLRP